MNLSAEFALYPRSFFSNILCGPEVVLAISAMDDMQCKVVISLATKCGKWTTTRVASSTLEGIHTTSQECLGMSVKEFRKKIVEITDAPPVSVDAILSDFPQAECSMSVSPRAAETDTLDSLHAKINSLQDDFVILRDSIQRHSDQADARISRINAILLTNQIRYRPQTTRP